MPPRTNFAEGEKRLDRIEIAIAQLAHGVRVGVGWKPEHNGQEELVEVLEDARGHVEGQVERRPHRAPEFRAKAVA